jgi:hypothetical protein
MALPVRIWLRIRYWRDIFKTPEIAALLPAAAEQLKESSPDPKTGVLNEIRQIVAAQGPTAEVVTRQKHKKHEKRQKRVMPGAQHIDGSEQVEYGSALEKEKSSENAEDVNTTELSRHARQTTWTQSKMVQAGVSSGIQQEQEQLAEPAGFQTPAQSARAHSPGKEQL